MEPNMITLDIESEAIEDGCPLLPKPVGISIKTDDQPSNYLAFGHPTENNCTWEEARQATEEVWGQEWITHNGLAFDVPVLQHWFNLPPRSPMLTHDTLFMAYLHNPHARSLSLKALAEEWLGMPPDDQKEMNDWIILNVAECRTAKQAGAYICKAPGDLVGRYARSDTDMTYALYNYLEPLVRTMADPYNRERRLAPVLVEMQNRGVRCDLPRLKEDYDLAREQLYEADIWVRDKLNSPDLNPASDKELGLSLKAAGYTGFLKTPKGADSVSKPSLEKVLESDPELKEMLWRRSTLATLTGTFMEPWIRYAEANGGRIHAGYNQVRNPEGYGTRTGRLSSSKPNFQNVPTDLLHGMPRMRLYLLPEEGHVWTRADFKQQEPRIAAHFEDGAMMRAFIDDPALDPYLFIVELAAGVTRKEAKVIFLGILYTMGAAALADRLDDTPEKANTLRNIIKASMPDIVALERECKAMFRRGLPIKTLGSRLYHCEPPSNGRSWEYKALNTLIQGSASDQTKEAIIYVAEHLEPGERVLGTVHDEISVSHPPSRLEDIRQIMHEAANSLPCDVPMLMDIKSGANWHEAS